MESAPAESARWEAAIKRIRNCVVSIHFTRPRSWDSEGVQSSWGTGFIVDAENGFILTNRHIVGHGPFTGYCVFYTSHEECEVKAVYRDPVHDFGFLRFNPRSAKYTTLKQVELRPDLAQIGCEVRILGNDAKEKGNSILSGHISHLDYNSAGCLNAYYIQSAMLTSGGSSGSPVFNVDGHVVGLHCSADVGATRFHVPLEGPVDVLKCLQNKKSVARGTIFSEFVSETFDRCRRLGLSDEWESALRKHHADGDGALVVHKVLPGSPIDGKLQAGDVLIKVNDALITQLKNFNRILDGNVADMVKILIQRNGVDIDLETKIQDLHSGTPDRFVEVAGAVFHDLTYKEAHRSYRSAHGVFLAQSSVDFSISEDSVIKSIDDKATPDLKAFIEVMKTYPDVARMEVKYESHSNPDIIRRKVIDMDQRWSPSMAMANRDDEAGTWHFKTLAHASEAQPPPPKSGSIRKVDSAKYPIVDEVFKSFVRIHCQRAVPMDGFDPWSGDFFGLVVDADQGLIVASRAWVPFELCALRVQIADTIHVPGTVVFLHPLASFAIIKYDTSLVQADVKTAKLSTETPKKGDSHIFFGLTSQYEVIMKATILDIRPFWVMSKFECMELEPETAHGFCDGALINEAGEIQAFWLAALGDSSLSGLGLPAAVLVESIKSVREGLSLDFRVLGVEVDTVDLAQAPPARVPEEHLQEIRAASRREMVEVTQVDCMAQPKESSQSLLHGDFILKINGELVTHHRDVVKTFKDETLDILILREGVTKQLAVPTLRGTDILVNHVLVTFGAYLQQPAPSARKSLTTLPSQIYVSYRLFGSPSDFYGLHPQNFIVNVNDNVVATLADFRREITQIPNNTYFRLTIMGLDRTPRVLPMKKDEHYFPCAEFLRKDGIWSRHEIKTNA